MKFEKGKIYRAFSDKPGLINRGIARAFYNAARKIKAPVIIVQQLPGIHGHFEFTVQKDISEEKMQAALLATKKETNLLLTVMQAPA